MYDGSQFALFGGNSNNDGKVGTFYLNLNNAVSNANWNNGAALSYLFMVQSLNVRFNPYHLVKINS